MEKVQKIDRTLQHNRQKHLEMNRPLMLIEAGKTFS
jgi:hypothetical protein